MGDDWIQGGMTQLEITNRSEEETAGIRCVGKGQESMTGRGCINVSEGITVRGPWRSSLCNTQ